MDDEELKEKFHELTLMLERIHSDYEMLNIAIRGLEAQMKLLKNELTMPSGKMTQQFAKLETQIQQLSAKPVQ